MSAGAPGSAASLVERLRALTDLLEEVAANWSALDQLPAEDRRRLHDAVARIYNPDPVARRNRIKASERHRKVAAARKDDERRAQTGIQTLRRQLVFTTPNVFPPGRLRPGSDEGSLSQGSGEPQAVPDGDEDIGQPDWSGGAQPEPRRGARRDGGRCCYVCKQTYATIHHFYDQLCPDCAALNFSKRTELADLRGRTALLTGGRVKIGYQAGLKLLRCGAHLIVTTRFPRNAAARYAEEPDFHDWNDRLQIFGLDLRHTPSVEAFCRELLVSRSRLDVIVNNACQTVRRPPDFYAHMMTGETAALREMPADQRRLLGTYEGLRGYHMLPDGHAPSAGTLDRQLAAVAGFAESARLSQVPLLEEELTAQKDLFPEGRLDQDLQQVDLRGRNSWRLLLAEVSSVELLEVQLVNAIAPFVLNARLKPLMLRTSNRDKHIVNVSAVEGQFYRNFKTTRHPHTNMAKAALNMMTRTAATDYHNDGIHMNSVDTGWVTDEDPAEIAARKTVDHRFHPPLDIIDGAARIVDPIITGINTGTHLWGQFLKDYRPTNW